MSYVVLARKYRPQKFSEVVGQDHVTQTLQNAFRQSKVGQAYLFTGTRGVGKTSVARILAKALRCEAPDAQPGKPNYGTPCNKCQSCIEVGQSSSLDVVEIDGASNNGVDNVREIRESVKFHPSRGRMKVYIIDEVHMLTGAAFNALLKTLEEPPAHAAFIFATTESHKVPATILSRVQRFDLKRVPQPLIFDYLMQIAKREGLSANPDALQLVARKAEGSIRDSLSLLDQVIALSGKEIALEEASAALGIVRRDLATLILKSAFANDGLAAVGGVQTAYESGVDMKTLATELAENVRNALLVKLGASTELLGILKEERAALEEIAGGVANETLQAAFHVLASAVGEIARSPLPRAALELAVLRLPQLTNLQSFAGLMQRLETLEGKAKGIAPTTREAVSLAQNAPIHNAPSTMGAAAPAASAPPTEISWKDFVSYVTRNKPSLGALLEHAMPLESVDRWQQAESVRLGFRENQSFYHDQAKSPAYLRQLEKLVAGFLGMPTKKIAIEKTEKVEKTVAQPQQKTLSEKKAETRQEKVEALKQKFMKQDIVRDTHEIFGTELTGFDINTDEETKR